MQFYIHHNKKMFSNTINCHTEIIYEKWVTWINRKMHLAYDFKQLQNVEFFSIKNLQSMQNNNGWQ